MHRMRTRTPDQLHVAYCLANPINPVLLRSPSIYRLLPTQIEVTSRSCLLGASRYWGYSNFLILFAFSEIKELNLTELLLADFID